MKRFIAGSAFVLLLAAGTARAIDPLPADIQNASPEVQARYLETVGRKSLEEKIKVGHDRYQARVELRQGVHKQMYAEVLARQAEMSASFDRGIQPSKFMSFLKPTAIVVGCGIALIIVVQAWRRTALA